MAANLNQSGTVFNIQKFSLNDGPGIRTAVFFKGCPLHCKWCANPESQSTKVQILWDKGKCIGCGKCTVVCPQKAVTATEQGLVTNERRCIGCGKCVAVCEQQARTAEGETKTVGQVLGVCMQDVDFYEESGGGVTLSGGEAMMQPAFAVELLKALHEKGIHTAIETTGFAAPQVFDDVVRYIDLLLFDIKHWSDTGHRAGTGVSNVLILQNMRRAIEMGKDVLPRLPVIPGYNNSLEDAAGFVKRLQEAGAKRVQLLPFHQFGEKKYEMLGRDYSYTDIPALHEEDLKEFQKVFLDAGIEAFF